MSNNIHNNGNKDPFASIRNVPPPPKLDISKFQGHSVHQLPGSQSPEAAQQLQHSAPIPDTEHETHASSKDVNSEESMRTEAAVDSIVHGDSDETLRQYENFENQIVLITIPEPQISSAMFKPIDDQDSPFDEVQISHANPSSNQIAAPTVPASSPTTDLIVDKKKESFYQQLSKILDETLKTTNKIGVDKTGNLKTKSSFMSKIKDFFSSKRSQKAQAKIVDVLQNIRSDMNYGLLKFTTESGNQREIKDLINRFKHSSYGAQAMQQNPQIRRELELMSSQDTRRRTI